MYQELRARSVEALKNAELRVRRGGAGKRRDLAEKPIREALKAVGAECWQLNDPDVGDLLVRFRGVLYCGEVKSGDRKLRKNQGAFPVWRTPEQVLDAIGVTRRSTT